MVFLKNLALTFVTATLGTTSLVNSIIYHNQVNKDHVLTKTKKANHKNTVNFPDNNPVFDASKHDSQGADSLTLEDVNNNSFVLNYKFSAATLAYFYPAIGALVNPGQSLFNLMTTGKAWSPTTHYWAPLKTGNAISTFLTGNVYPTYVHLLLQALTNSFYYDTNDNPTTDMSNLQRAVETGSAFSIAVQAQVANEAVTSVSKIQTKIIPCNYPHFVTGIGADAVFGNMFEPSNVLTINISKPTCATIYQNFHSNFAGFISWLFGASEQGFKASTTLNALINNNANTRGNKYNGGQLAFYWNDPNYNAVQTTLQAQFQATMQAAHNPSNAYGITLSLSRMQAGNATLAVSSQLQPYRPTYYKTRSASSNLNYDYIFLNVLDIMSLRAASFRYLTPTGGFTNEAYQYAMVWLYDICSPWDNSDVVHPFQAAGLISDPNQWNMALKIWNWKNVDQLMAELIIQDRGATLQLVGKKTSNPTINVYGQNINPNG